MASWKKIEDIDVWRDARVLSKHVHKICIANKIDFRLRDQMFGSSGSIMDNIAEGFEVGNNRDFRKYLGYARGSCGELRSQLYRSLDKGLIDQATFEKLNNEAIQISKRLKTIIISLKNNNQRGFQFDEPLIPYGDSILEEE